MLSRVLTGLVLCLWATAASAADVVLLTTDFVLGKKLDQVARAADAEGVSLHWLDVSDTDAEGLAAAIQAARLIVVDAPRQEDIAEVESRAGEYWRRFARPVVHINRMNWMSRLRAERIESDFAERLYAYYLGGREQNRAYLAQFLALWLKGEDWTQVPDAVPMPDGAIYHPDAPGELFTDLADYLEWWQQRMSKDWKGLPVVGMETSSSYIADAQNRMLDEFILGAEARNAVPVVYYRDARNLTPPSREGRSGGGRPEGSRPGAGQPMAAAEQGEPVIERNPGDFPNPMELAPHQLDEPLITLGDELIVDVMTVNTFLGVGPDQRLARYRAQNMPVLNVINYRNGNREEYQADLAGISTFYIPFRLSVAEYIGIQDPVVLSTNEGGEMVPMPEQLDLLLGKAVKLAQLKRKANADKRLALVFWNTPAGEQNISASNMNVPRSVAKLIEDLKAEGYRLESRDEQALIDSFGTLLRPFYRKEALQELTATEHWAFMPLADYQRWFEALPASVRSEITGFWGDADSSGWLVEKDGEKGFAIPRIEAGNLVILPQPKRSDRPGDEREKDLFHDTKVPLHHGYLATYLWLREGFGSDAIIHFGTHGSQEWTPGKERGLWAYDYPNLLVGNTPVLYPYIVDNIGEAIHVKRRGRGVVISHQTPAFSPAGLAPELTALNDLLREYHGVDEGMVKETAKANIIEAVIEQNLHKDVGLDEQAWRQDFETHLRRVEDHIELLAGALQPLGLHTFGDTMTDEHRAMNLMLILLKPLAAELGIDNPDALFVADYEQIKQTEPYRFVLRYVVQQAATDALPPTQQQLVREARQLADNYAAEAETRALITGLSSGFIDPSYGGDPIRNPDALPTGRNIYGFDPNRVPTQAAYDAGVKAMQELIDNYKAQHGRYPQKLTFTLWSTETMRHLGMLEAQIFWALGVKPVWDRGGRVTGIEAIPQQELGRPRIDTVISLTGLYRDQFPVVMERFNEAVMLVAALKEPKELNFVRANTERIRAELVAQGIPAEQAENHALTRVFGTESGDYGTKLPEATLGSDQWEEGDGKLEELYLSRMSWAYGPDASQWSRKLTDAEGKVVNTYAQHLKGTDAAVFSRSSNLRGLLDTDHPFEYLGSISMAVKYLDGEAPQLYISNMRDPRKARLQDAANFMAMELRSVYQHPNWVKEMMQEDYAGTLNMLKTINNFWGWQVMDRNVVRDDQWQAFHEVYVKDKYELGLREWFEQSNPTALAQISERMIEAIRKGYWEASDETLRELVEVYTEIAAKHDVYTENRTFAQFVADKAAGYGISAAPAPDQASSAATPPPEGANELQPQGEQVSGQKLEEVSQEVQDSPLDYWLFMLLLPIAAGFWHQGRRARA
ncbi:MAG: cobaltochelatase subunit CobN [Marinobacterium sp.]